MDGQLNVFVSYRRSDSSGYAGRVYDFLSQQFGREHVFYDIDGIAPGRDFVEVLTETLDRTQVLLVLIGRGWLDAADEQGARRIDQPHDFVRIEIESALGRPDVRVIPVLVGGAAMPTPTQLPDSLAPLARRNAISLIDEHWRATITELVTVLERVRDEPSPPASAPRIPEPQPSVPETTADEPSTPGVQSSASAPDEPRDAEAGRAHAPVPEAQEARKEWWNRRSAKVAAVLSAVVVIAAGAVVVHFVDAPSAFQREYNANRAQVPARIRSTCDPHADSDASTVVCTVGGERVDYNFGETTVDYIKRGDSTPVTASTCETKPTGRGVANYSINGATGWLSCNPGEVFVSFKWMPDGAAYTLDLTTTEDAPETYASAYDKWKRVAAAEAAARAAA